VKPISLVAVAALALLAQPNPLVAQTPAPSAPPAAPVAPAEPVEPAPALPPPAPFALPPSAPFAPLPPLPPMPDLSFDFDFDFDFEMPPMPPVDIDLAQSLHDRQDIVRRVEERWAEAWTRHAEARENVEERVAEARARLAEAREKAAHFRQAPKPGPVPKPGVKVLVGSDRDEDRAYQNGTRALDNARWDEALQHFNRVVALGGPRADGAMYWIAWAQNKQGNRAPALEWLGRLRQSHPTSRWVMEARALEVEIRQASGQPVRPENVPDDELRLMALNSLARADEQRAIPMLDKIVKGTGSPRLKERALFVLAQNGAPQSRQIVTEIAKGGGNPDLQAKAVEYLGAFGTVESKQALLEVFRATNNLPVKRSIIRAFGRAGDRDRLLDVTRTEELEELRAEAVQQLGNMGAQDQLSQLYKTEKSADVRRRIVQAMFQGHNYDALIQMLRAEEDPGLRRSIVQNLGQMRTQQSSTALMGQYGSEKDENVRRAIIDAFFNQRDDAALVELGRKEADPKMQQRIMERLSQMKSQKATDYFMEVLSK
jgi:HEAT repeat protein